MLRGPGTSAIVAAAWFLAPLGVAPSAAAGEAKLGWATRPAGLASQAPTALRPTIGPTIGPQPSWPTATPVSDYRVTFLSCRTAAGDRRLAIRTLVRAGMETLLLVDPQSLATELAARAAWDCAETSEEAEGSTRFVAALRRASPDTATSREAAASSQPLRNAGIVGGAGGGSFVTGDLCPSPLPLDRGFLERLARLGPRVPVALSITGVWLRTHPQDVRWLQERARQGDLAITWVNHSYHHPYVPGWPPAQNFLLLPDLDIDREILATERLLIEAGETPSVFFRFPGLISNAALGAAVRRHHLVTLGAASWLGMGQPSKPGAVVLVHPNGNEPRGLALFGRDLDAGTLPLPLRPIADAP